MLTVRHTAERLGVSPKHVRRLLRKGVLRGLKLVSASGRIKEGDSPQ